MNYYFAPMEGVTLYPLRNVHREVFGKGVDKYYTPFLTAAHTHHFKNREKKDVLPECNRAFDDYPRQIVPQIMAGCSEDFIWAAKEISKLGYEEVNLNLGCPAPTVVNRRKGAGLLQDPEYLDKMLSEIFAAGPFPAISLKTRLGFSDEAEADRLMEIYAKYPISELTIHARVREDFYAGAPRIEAFRRSVSIYRESGGKAPVCYNGNVDSVPALQKLMQEISPDEPSRGQERSEGGVSSIMIGRGLLANPALVRQLKGGEQLKPSELKEYLGKLYEGYATYIPEDRNVIFKMLEHWAYLHVHFKNCDRNLKNIRKSRSKDEYLAAVNRIFAECNFS